jgi:hypothetical protein
MLNMAEWCERAAKVQDRVCRIELQGNPVGTGFLVGPEVVLTNYHVMEQAIKGQIPPSAVTLRFDYKQLADGTILSGGMHRLADDWRIDASPYSTQDLQGLPDDASRDPKELDYALLRVAGAPGNQKVDRKGSDDAPVRGWISVPETEVTFVPNHPLFIVQHPQGTPLKLALDTQAVIAVNANRTRVRYQTNTEPGSSGSPCFDQHWELVALHHLGDPNFHATYNQGIPIAAIRGLLKERGKDNHLGGDAP